MTDRNLSSVSAITLSLGDLLEAAISANPTYGIDHALNESDLDRLIQQIDALPLASLRQQAEGDASRQTQFARIETAVRNVFNSLLV